MPKVMIILEVADQARVREMVAMWAHGLIGKTVEVHHPLGPDLMPPYADSQVGELLFLDFDAAEIVNEPPAQRRLTKLDLQEKLGVSGGRDE